MPALKGKLLSSLHAHLHTHTPFLSLLFFLFYSLDPSSSSARLRLPSLTATAAAAALHPSLPPCRQGFKSVSLAGKEKLAVVELDEGGTGANCEGGREGGREGGSDE